MIIIIISVDACMVYCLWKSEYMSSEGVCALILGLVLRIGLSNLCQYDRFNSVDSSHWALESLQDSSSSYC